MQRTGEKKRIALLIVVAALAIAFAMLEALQGSSDFSPRGEPVQATSGL